jgi:hypothetical protein
MNVIYKLYLNNLQNFFVSQLKFLEKVRVALKASKKYEQPKTAYLSLLELTHFFGRQMEVLRRGYQLLNPNRFKQEIEDLKLVACSLRQRPAEQSLV